MIMLSYNVLTRHRVIFRKNYLQKKIVSQFIIIKYMYMNARMYTISFIFI